jgi:RimJ/RimL family protein N-acetyltransferase
VPVFLETARLALRTFTPDDADHLYDLNRDPDVTRYLSGGEPTPPGRGPRPDHPVLPQLQ